MEKSETFVQHFNSLFSAFQPAMLTDLVTEVLEDSSRETLVAHGIAEKLRHQLNSKAFSLGIVRLIRHEHHRSGHKVSLSLSFCLSLSLSLSACLSVSPLLCLYFCLASLYSVFAFLNLDSICFLSLSSSLSLTNCLFH